MKYLIVIFLFLLKTKTCYTQQEAAIWYFGDHAGLDFSNGNPVLLADGKINTDEGVASISDTTGKLLFYTDGMTVWDNQHLQMPNGFGLLGHISSTQSAIIVPFINDKSRYYIFTVDQLGGIKGLNYSIVNMTLNNGRGDIEAKNTLIITPVCEKITAVRHCNGKDIWLITHKWKSDELLAYLISGSGISTTAVVSYTGRYIGPNVDQSIGYLKASPDGTKLAAAHKLVGVDLFDFNNSTGIASNRRALLANNYLSYGVEFSPNSTMLYISASYFDLTDFKDRNAVIQFDLTSASLADILSSMNIVYKINRFGEFFGALQLAPDGKIYLAQFNYSMLSVIESPDQPGNACNFSVDKIQLPLGIFCRRGLPSFIQSYLKSSFKAAGECAGMTIQFKCDKPSNITSVKWDFGDPSSGSSNNSTLESVSHLFSTPGVYTVKLISFGACGSDTLSKTIMAGELEANLRNDTIICGNNTAAVLDPKSILATSYLWNDGSTTPTLPINQPGTYWVEVSSVERKCIKRDTIKVTYNPYPEFYLGNDTILCRGSVLPLKAPIQAADYLWSNGEKTDGITITQPGDVWLHVSEKNCAYGDTLTVVFNQYPTVSLGNDTTLCEYSTLTLHAQNTGSTYLWQDNSTNNEFKVSKEGTYYVKVFNGPCSLSDTIYVAYQKKPYFSLGQDFILCDGKNIELKPGHFNAVYSWQDGSNGYTYQVKKPGTYHLTLSNLCGQFADSIVANQGICDIYIPNIFTPNNDRKNEQFRISGGELVREFSMKIYNRWGQLVFSSDLPKNGWDGTLRGQPVPNGTYIYVISYQSPYSKQPLQRKGTFILAR